MDHQIVGVIGSGVMGGGIAQLFAEKGFQTLIWDTTLEMATRGCQVIRKRIDKRVETGKLPAEAAAAIIGRISPIGALEDLAPAGLIIEAVIEDFESKVGIFNRLEACISPKTALGTNTSSLSVAALAQRLVHPERFLGIHFFNPPTKLDLVEVVVTPGLAPDILQTVQGILASCGKTAITVKDSPGFIVNRLLLPLINEAAKLVDEGVASPAEIDTAMRLGALHPAGPLQVADLIGLDVCRNILRTLAKSLDNPFYQPAKSLVDLVAAGKLGRKTGQGYYTY
jgi:3-hydroxybutyryl-CoA dehydrogenase